MPLKTQFIRQYRALLTQIGTNNPGVTELHNTFDDLVVWERITAGTYTGTFSNITLDINKTVLHIENTRGGNYIFRIYWSSSNSVTVQTWTLAYPGEPVDADEVLSVTPVSIELFHIEEPKIIPSTPITPDE